MASSNSRESLLRDLSGFKAGDEREQKDLEKMLEFAGSHENAFDRRIAERHFTSSAVVVDPTRSKVLLVHHKKLNKWLQLGGHAEEGEHSGLAIALREASEESGVPLNEFKALNEKPFDLDIHLIPARGSEKEHHHYDLRYLLECVSPEKTQVLESESNYLKLFTWAEAKALGLGYSLVRALEKAKNGFKD